MGDGECFVLASSACGCWGKASDEVVELADVDIKWLSSYKLLLRPALNGIFTGDDEGECSALMDMTLRTFSFRRLVALVLPSFLARERA